MNFFKSILSDDPDPAEPGKIQESDSNSNKKPSRDDSNQSAVADGWGFGSLIKTIATQSESMFEIYRRDLQEFGSGLRKETEIFRETANRAVKDLPASLEASASAAHGALDGVLKSTAGVISKEDMAFAADGEPEMPETIRSLSAGRYSWFQAQLRAIQGDLNTFCEDPDDAEEYTKWRSGFKLEENRDEIVSLIGENGTLEGIYKRVVPSAVDPEIFWCRYFYRVYKLQQQESRRANLVKRAISADDEEEELSWDVDDEEEEEDGNGSKQASDTKLKGRDGFGSNVASAGSSNPVEKPKGLNNELQDKKEAGNVTVDNSEKSNAVKLSKKSSVDEPMGKKDVKPEEVAEAQKDEKVKTEESVKEKTDEKGDSGKKSDASLLSSHQSKVEEEGVEWDEIEDTGSGDEKKISVTTRDESKNRVDLRKRLSAVEDDDDEDLNWDIDGDDEPVTA